MGWYIHTEINISISRKLIFYNITFVSLYIMVSSFKFLSPKIAEYHHCSTLCRQSFSLLKWSCPFSWTSFHKQFSMIITRVFSPNEIYCLCLKWQILGLHGQTNDLQSILLYELKVQKCTALFCNLWPLALKVFSMYFGKVYSTTSLLSCEFSSLGILFSLCNGIFGLLRATGKSFYENETFPLEISKICQDTNLPSSNFFSLSVKWNNVTVIILSFL